MTRWPPRTGTIYLNAYSTNLYKLASQLHSYIVGVTLGSPWKHVVTQETVPGRRQCSMHYVLGVDGGNTKTIALVASLDGAILGAGRGGCGDIYNAPTSTEWRAGPHAAHAPPAEAAA